MQTQTFPVSNDLYASWVAGQLPKKWQKKYPELFDKEDLRLALAQPTYHFVEWIAAIHLFASGYLSLVEQYIYKPHKRKFDIIKKYIGESGLEFLRRKNKEMGAQPPDLFVYKGDEFFFVEVKSASDKIRSKQTDFFQEIEKEFHTRVVYLKAENA